MLDPTIGHLVAREDRNAEVERLLAILEDARSQLRDILTARERELRFVARLSATGGWRLDLSRSPVVFTPSIEWLELHGYQRGQRPSLLQAIRHVARKDRAILLKALRRCVAHGEAIDLPVCVRHCDGHLVYMRMLAEAVRDDSGAITRVEGACQDVTAQVRREHELAAHRDRLEELVDQRTSDLQTFSHALAHDLRAPIAAMAGFAQVIAQRSASQLDERSRHRLERIVANAHHAAALIDGILSLVSHLQGPLRKQVVDVTAIVHGVLDQLRAADPARRVNAVVQEGMTAYGDGRLLMSVFGNLVSNAWKFTGPRDDPRIEVGRMPDGSFFVRDNGVGFDPAEAGQLFKPLQRLHHAQEFSGLGIGLATAHRIILRHGGNIWAEAQPEAGATFRFTLPPGP